MLGDVADRKDDAEVEGDGFLAGGDPVVGQGVLVAVPGRVVGLAGDSDDAGHGGQADEKVKVGWEEIVEVSCPGNFRLDWGVEVRVAHGFESGVLEGSLVSGAVRLHFDCIVVGLTLSTIVPTMQPLIGGIVRLHSARTLARASRFVTSQGGAATVIPFIVNSSKSCFAKLLFVP